VWQSMALACHKIHLEYRMALPLHSTRSLCRIQQPPQDPFQRNLHRCRSFLWRHIDRHNIFVDLSRPCFCLDGTRENQRRLGSRRNQSQFPSDERLLLDSFPSILVRIPSDGLVDKARHRSCPPPNPPKATSWTSWLDTE